MNLIAPAELIQRIDIQVFGSLSLASCVKLVSSKETGKTLHRAHFPFFQILNLFSLCTTFINAISLPYPAIWIHQPMVQFSQSS